MYLKSVKTGDRVFIGNDAVIPPGSEIPTGALIGIKSKPPANSELSEGDTWFGSPPIKLPVRQKFDGGGATWTYDPPAWKKLLRAAYEAVNVSLPTMLFMTFGTWAVESFGQSLVDGEYTTVVELFILDSVLISFGMTLAVVIVKWVTMGRYEPQVKPMWSFWAMRTEACAVLYWDRREGAAGAFAGHPISAMDADAIWSQIWQGRVHGYDRHHRVRLRARRRLLRLERGHGVADASL